MTLAGILRPVLEVGPNEKGEGSKMALFWDGALVGVIEAEFQGSTIRTEVLPERLLEDVRELTRQACLGELQIVQRDEVLETELVRAVLDGD